MRIQFKDKISSFYQRRVDISGNVKKNYQNLLQNTRLYKDLNKPLSFLAFNKYKNQRLLLGCFLLKHISKLDSLSDYASDSLDSSEDSLYDLLYSAEDHRMSPKRHKQSKWSIWSPIRSIISDVLEEVSIEEVEAYEKKISIFKDSFLLKNRIRRRIEENKVYNSSIALISRKLPHPIRKNIETDLVEFTPYIKLQLPGFPKLINKKRKKLRKKLLIFRLRHKFKFITLLQNIALHSFIGTQTLSYANLVKKNQLNLSSIIYQYRLSKKSKQRVGYKARKFLKRPFKLSKMNQARFHISKDDWFDKMQEQMIEAYNRV